MNVAIISLLHAFVIIKEYELLVVNLFMDSNNMLTYVTKDTNEKRFTIKFNVIGHTSRDASIFKGRK